MSSSQKLLQSNWNKILLIKSFFFSGICAWKQNTNKLTFENFKRMCIWTLEQIRSDKLYKQLNHNTYTGIGNLEKQWWIW